MKAAISLDVQKVRFSLALVVKPGETVTITTSEGTKRFRIPSIFGEMLASEIEEEKDATPT
jgi:hypothetical protein